MKKMYSILSCALLALPVMAQEPQLPNSDFEGPWGDCIPWTSSNNTAAKGTTPQSWTISQVIGMNTLGATIVGDSVEGYNSRHAVKVYNSPNSIMATQIVPGYVTLGTTWSTSVMGSQNDGGTFGGIEFNGRPEKITFMYKFERAEENDQPANAIAYLWKGTYTQANVPGNIAAFGSPKAVDMVNRDRNILGIETSKGGEVTKSEGAELIAKGTTVIKEVTSEWVKGEIVFEYFSDATPEMINVIFSANDYFNAEGIAKGNALTVDDVKCEYAAAGVTKKYPGKLVVEMMGGELTGEGGDDTTIEITETSAATCTFLLPNLSLGELGVIGDIKLDVVNMSTANGVTTYTAHDPALSLLGGEIIADVTLNGTTDEAGVADMKIDVIWSGIPITCTFKGKLATSGVGSIEIENAPVEMYNLNGVRVNPETAAPGLYIKRQGNKVSKVIVR